jgi:predicted enzyme related to lactoylglutathione lyase
MAMSVNYQIMKMSPQLVVTHLEGSIGFYTNQLGFDIDFRYEDFYAGIIKNGFSIHLKSGQPLVNERLLKKDHEHVDITFSVDHFESLYEELVNRSVEIIQPLRDMPYGREFYISDPDGYIIAFLEGN